jgi:CRP-like cAMP-binding protein
VCITLMTKGARRQLCGVIDSMLLQKPSTFYYETLTASTFLRARATDLIGLMEEEPGISKVIYTGMAHALSGLLERMVELQCFSSEDKFRKLLTRSPHILTLVPHKYIANYLGIDATNFSKLVNRIRI